MTGDLNTTARDVNSFTEFPDLSQQPATVSITCGPADNLEMRSLQVCGSAACIAVCLFIAVWFLDRHKRAR